MIVDVLCEIEFGIYCVFLFKVWFIRKSFAKIWNSNYQICETCQNVKFEPPHDKTKKMTVHPVKTQTSLGIRPVWSESLLVLNG